MDILHNIWSVILLLGTMILVHELGHYWAALLCDVRVEAFSFGFGPRIFGFRRGETDFRLSLIPFGGYVKMAGEQLGDENTVVDDPRSFLAKPRWQRMFIAFAGPFMNVILAIAVMAGLFMVKFPKVKGADDPFVVGFVTPDSVADKAGIQDGDRVVKFDNKENLTWREVDLIEIGAANRPVPIVLDRNGQQVLLTVTPKLEEKYNIGNIGWAPKNELLVQSLSSGMDAARVLKQNDVMLAIDGKPVYAVQRLHQILKEGQGKPVELSFVRDGKPMTTTITPKIAEVGDGTKRYLLGVFLAPRYVYVQLAPLEAMKESLKVNWAGTGLIYSSLRGIVERRLSAKGLEGPVGIAKMAGDMTREGTAEFLNFMCMVSLNLAIFNLLPIPILDGGMILTLLIEMVMRRDLSMPVKEAVFKMGFVFLMMLVVFVLYNDITKHLPG